MRNLLAAGVAVAALLLSGCGGGGGAANVITIRISSSSGTSLILGQSTTLTATVTGATNTNVNWTPVCQYTTTTTDSTGKTTTSKPANCPEDMTVTPPDPNHTIFGVFSNQQPTGTEVFTAPSTLPDQTKYPGLVIIATAQSVQNTSKTGTINLAISSGIRVTFSPGTATVPTKEQQRFTALLTNDLGNKGVTWSITQQVPNSTAGSTPNPFTPLATCSPTCGTLTVPNSNDPNTVVYTAPDTVPNAITPAQKNNTNSPANVTIVAVSNADKSCSLCFVIGTITIIPGGPITFNGITPTIAPQGATLWDIYLDAPNISSASTINLTYGSSTTPVLKDSASGQIKVLFPVPASSSSSTSPSTCSTTNPCSSGARLRLLAPDLVPPPSCPAAQPCPVTVSVTDLAQPCNTSPAGTACTATGTTTFNLMPVRATSTATVPDDIVQGGQTQTFPVTIDGGYFGPYGPNLPSPNNLTRVFFQSSGNTLNVNQTSSNSRQLITSLPANNINPTKPGLYPLYVVSTATPAPSPNNPSVTNMALFPDYSTTQPAVSSGASGIPAGMNPSAVDIDPDLGVLVVAETGSNTIEFFSIGNGVLASICTVGNTASTTTCPGDTPAPINVPTGVSVNRTNHTVAVVNYGSQTITKNSDGTCNQATPTGQSVTLLNIPGSPTPVTGLPFSVDLPFNTNLGPTLQGSVCPAPMPYSIGVDPDSNLALVTYSATSSSSVNNLGFIINLNPNSGTNNYGCALTDAITGQSPSSGPVGRCLFAQVTLNVGTYPQVAMAPHGHLGLVTPGGSGAIRGVDVTKPSTANLISSATLTAGLVTVTVDTTKCPPGVSATSSSSTNPCPLLMVPGNGGSVLIAGLTTGNAANSAFFNGVFSVNVTSNNSFAYVVNTTATDACKPPNSTTTSCGGEVFYGSPDQIFGLPATTQGIAINPFTSTAAIADANATGTNGPQIDLLSGLDQSVSSIFFFANCTAFTTSCSSAPEFLPTADVAWQPYTNSLVSYNPHLNQVSISDPVTRRRYAFANQTSPCSPTTPGPTTLCGTGTATLVVQNGTGSTANPATLQLFGGLAVDPATNQAFVVKSGSSTIDIIDLNGSTPIKSTHISEVIVPSTSGVPQAVVPQAALACTTPVFPATTCDLPGVRIFGSGFSSGMQVRLDGIALPAGDVGPPLNGGREVDVTIPASIPTADPNNPFKPLSAPHKFALDILSNGAQSNAVDFIVVQSVDLSTVCTDSSGNPTNTQPSSVAIADQIANGLFSPIALVSVTGCNDIVVIDLNPTVAGQPNPNFGKPIGSPVSVGTSPQGIAIWQRKGLAVVANNGSNTVSVLDLTPLPTKPPVKAVPDITNSNGIGTNPTGVAINDATGAAIVTNTGSNTISMINLGLLFPPSGTTPPTTLTATSIGGIQEPTAVAIDPDRGTNNQGIAVVTALQLSNGSVPTGALAVVEIGLATPALSTTISSGFVSSTPTGIVFDPAVATGGNPGVFFANSSGTNSITEFNPDSGGGSSVSVGINPTSLAINPQTGAMLTSNSASNTISVVDTISSPFKTRQTLGFPGSPTFGVAIDQFTNLAVIVDQANNRVLLFPMPN